MKAIHQMTLRLPADLAQLLAARTPARKRNQFVVELVRRELLRESRELEAAAIRLSQLEAGATEEETAWLTMDDAQAWGEFDEQKFLQELHEPTPPRGGLPPKKLP